MHVLPHTLPICSTNRKMRNYEPRGKSVPCPARCPGNFLRDDSANIASGVSGFRDFDHLRRYQTLEVLEAQLH
jgi:hypothetical protein